MANTMEEQKTTDPEKAERERKLTFAARVSGIITGMAGGSMVGYRWLKRSLFSSMRDALYRPDWQIFHANDYDPVKNRTDDYPAYIHEVFTEAQQKEWLKKTGNNPVFLAKRFESVAPDNAIRAAFKHICKTDSSEKNFVNPVAIEAQKAFEGQRQAKLDIYNGLIARTQRTYVNDKEKLNSEIIKQNERLRKFLYADYKKYFEEAIFNEIWKRGNKDGHLGFGLRQADNKEEIMVFGAVAGVSLGFLAYKATKWLLHRNDDRQEQTHQQQLTAQREAASAETAQTAH